MAHRKSPAVGRLSWMTSVCGSVTVIDWMALSEDLRGLVLVWLRLASTSSAVTGCPLEKTMLGRMCRVTVE